MQRQKSLISTECGHFRSLISYLCLRGVHLSTAENILKFFEIKKATFSNIELLDISKLTFELLRIF